jgi:hypothetical protein
VSKLMCDVVLEITHTHGRVQGARELYVDGNVTTVNTITSEEQRTLTLVWVSICTICKNKEI